MLMIDQKFQHAEHFTSDVYLITRPNLRCDVINISIGASRSFIEYLCECTPGGLTGLTDAWMCVSRILKQIHFEGRQCSKNIPILMVTCGKHTHIEGLFPVISKNKPE